MDDNFKEVANGFQTPEERETAVRILDLIKQTMNTADPKYTGFLNPTEQEVLRAVTRRYSEIRYMLYGGYRTAERKRGILMPSFFINEYLEFNISAIEILPEDEAHDKLTHGDYLGSILALGLNRDRIGDIVVLSDRGQVVVDEGIADFIIANLRKVKRYNVETHAMDLERLDVVPERVEEIQRTVASLRLDSVAAAGYSTSRTKMAKDIKAKRVKVNWKETTSPALQVQPGDVISMAGRGRVVVEDILGETRKGRMRLQLKKLL